MHNFQSSLMVGEEPGVVAQFMYLPTMPAVARTGRMTPSMTKAAVSPSNLVASSVASPVPFPPRPSEDTLVPVQCSESVHLFHSSDCQFCLSLCSYSAKLASVLVAAVAGHGWASATTTFSPVASSNTLFATYRKHRPAGLNGEWIVNSLTIGLFSPELCQNNQQQIF